MRVPPGPVLRCQSCDMAFPLDVPVWRCSCGGVIDVRDTAMFAREQLAQRPMNFWRYREALALPDDAPRTSLGEVMTPLLNARFRDWKVTFKLDYLLPTGSYKDRGIAVCVNHLSGLGGRRVTEDSSGNAGASTAAYAAAAGIQADIYVPAGTSPAKISQTRICGARCHLVPGTRVDSGIAAQTDRAGAWYIGHSWNLLFACGIKSVAYEIAEQSDWSPPDWIVAPAGGGSLVMGLIDGFAELLAAGYVRRTPGVLAVQSVACAPIYQALLRGDPGTTRMEPRSTCAEGVALPDPPRGTQVLEALRRNAGTMLAVDDTELLSCWQDMARMELFVEPTSAVAVAGAWRARTDQALFSPGENVTIPLTGHGLKTKAALIEAA